MAKSKAAASGVHAQFRQRSVEKTYLAITCGVPGSTHFVVDAPIDRHSSILCGIPCLLPPSLTLPLARLTGSFCAICGTLLWAWSR